MPIVDMEAFEASIDLVVVQDFAAYKRGARITALEEIQEILNSEHQGFVVKRLTNVPTQLLQ